eukprot:IDg21043t1
MCIDPSAPRFSSSLWTMSKDTYPSSEDTHLLLDVLQDDVIRLSDSLQAGGLCIEIGSEGAALERYLHPWQTF